MNGKDYAYYSFAKAAEKIGDVSKLPFSLKVLLENMLRFEDGGFQSRPTMRRRSPTGKRTRDRQGNPVPAGARAAAGFHRRALRGRSGSHARCNQQARRRHQINPQVPVNLVIDHSVMVEFGHPKAFEKNVELEYARNAERYDFLKWGSKSFELAVPPGTASATR